jgi:hypothetical protein
MINYNFIKKKFRLRILFILFIFSLIFSLLITFMNPLKVYKFKVNLSKLEYLNQLAGFGQENFCRSFSSLNTITEEEKFQIGRAHV